MDDWQGWVRRPWADFYRLAYPGRLTVQRAGPRAYLCAASTDTADHMAELAQQYPVSAGDPVSVAALRFLRDYL